MNGRTDEFREAAATLATVRDLLRFAVSRFHEAGLAFGHGSTNAYDEAAYLILHALHLPLDRLEPFLDARLTPSEIEATLELLRRRVEERVPAAYLAGEAWLGDFRFVVDERVIVPRSYIAELLEDGLAPWVDDPASITSALDLCTGSGSLAVLLAHAFGNARIDAVDLSADALEVARENVALYGLGERIALLQSDLFDALENRRYDVIVSNPPYVPDAVMESLPVEYRHEPRLALAGGADGFDVVRRILDEAPSRLCRSGVLVVEVGHYRSAVEAAFPDVPFSWADTRSGDDCVFVLRREDLA